MKPLTIEEVSLKLEMKKNCLNGSKYKDENAKAKFDMLCHLEDFEIQYWELLEENKKLKKVINKAIELLNDPWSFESGNKEVDEITHNKKREVIDILKEVSK